MKNATRIACAWSLVACLALPLAHPFVGSASAAWESPSDQSPTYFWGGESGPNDQTTDPDEPFDGLDRIVAPDKSAPAVQAPSPAASIWEQIVRLLHSLRVFER